MRKRERARKYCNYAYICILH